jgi:predicted dinucleotide-binding enzyme
VTRTPIHRSRTSRALPVALLAALALTVGPAPATAAPILLATRDEVPAATAGSLREHAVRSVLLVGGEDALSTSTPDRLRALGTGDVQRVAGADRYATSRAVAAFVPTATHALAAGPLGRATLLVGDDQSARDVVEAWFETYGAGRTTAVGAVEIAS